MIILTSVYQLTGTLIYIYDLPLILGSLHLLVEPIISKLWFQARYRGKLFLNTVTHTAGSDRLLPEQKWHLYQKYITFPLV